MREQARNCKHVVAKDLGVIMELSLPSCVRGHHIYKRTWTPTIGEVLSCERESSNTEDCYAVAVLQRGTVVGTVPRKISAACSLCLRRGGTIECTVTGVRCYSADMPQGGLEVLCELRFKGNPQDVAKLQKLLAPEGSSGAETNIVVEGTPVEQPRKKIKYEDVIIVEDIVLNICQHPGCH